MDSPCHQCDQRTADCHARCEAYASFSLQCEAIRKARYDRTELEGVFIHHKKRATRARLAAKRQASDD